MKKNVCVLLLLCAVGCGETQIRSQEDLLFLSKQTVKEIQKETHAVSLDTASRTHGDVVKRSERCILNFVQKGNEKKALEFAPSSYPEGSIGRMIEDLEKSVIVLDTVKGRKDAAVEKGTPWSQDEEVVLAAMRQNLWFLMDRIDEALKVSSL